MPMIRSRRVPYPSRREPAMLVAIRLPMLARGVERQHLVVLGQPRVQVGQAHAGLDRAGQVVRLMDEHPVEALQADHQIEAVGRHPQRLQRAAAPGRHQGAGQVGQAQQLAELLGALRPGHQRRSLAGDRVGVRVRAGEHAARRQLLGQALLEGADIGRHRPLPC
jgi:hypothetical protein